MSLKHYKLVRLLLLIFLGVWLVLIMFPFYFQIITSLKDVAEVNRIEPTFWPEVFVLENYSAIWNEPGNFKSLVDSFIIATCNTILSLFFGTLAGYALARFPRQSGGENVAMWILSNRMFPPVAVLLPMFFLFEELFGTTDTHMALIILYLVFNMPLAVWLMMVFFRDVPRELEEAAYVDGHKPFKVFFTITLPLVGPGMIAVAMLCWIFSWNEYLFANMFIGTDVKTFPVVIPSFTSGSQTLWNLVMAFSLVAMIPPVVLFIILRRYMVRGLSLGVVKG